MQTPTLVSVLLLLTSITNKKVAQMQTLCYLFYRDAEIKCRD